MKTRIALTTFFIALLGAAQGGTVSEMSPEAKMVNAAFDRYVHGWQTGDIDVLATVYAQDARLTAYWPDPTRPSRLSSAAFPIASRCSALRLCPYGSGRGSVRHLLNACWSARLHCLCVGPFTLALSRTRLGEFDKPLFDLSVIRLSSAAALLDSAPGIALAIDGVG